MYANVVTLRYKSRENLEEGVEKLKPLVDMLPSNPGFQSFALLRTGETETMNVVTFATEENARAARERMLPKVKEALASFLVAEPEARTAEVIVRK
jgi:heme-degrading monooxygenase HmoA